MFNIVKLHNIHSYIQIHTHTHTHLISHHMHEASVLILLVVYYMAIHTDTLKDTRLCIYVNSHGPLPHQHCRARGSPHMIDLPPHQKRREGLG